MTKTIPYTGTFIDSYQMAAGDPALAESTYYYWHVRVKDKFDQLSDWSDTAWFRVDLTAPTAAVPKVPGNASPFDTGDDAYWINTRTPTFEWELPDDPLSAGAASGMASIEIQISTSPTFASFFHKKTLYKGVDTDYTDGKYTLTVPLSGNGPYYWRIISYDKANEPVANSTISETFSFSMDFVPPDYFSINHEYPDGGIVNLIRLKIRPIGPNKETGNAYDPVCDLDTGDATSHISKIEYWYRKHPSTTWTMAGWTDEVSVAYEVELPDSGVYDIGAKLFDRSGNVRGWDYENDGQDNQGFLATYYRSPLMAGPAGPDNTHEIRLRCIGQSVWSDYGNESPTKIDDDYNSYIVPPNDFLVHWTGQFNAETAGNYRFRTRTDDGVKFYIDDAIRIDKWVDQGPTTWATTPLDINLTAGWHKIDMYYYEHSGGAMASLEVDLPGGAVTYNP
ncbi:MAG TPA: PA14 domain-containing protein, partial [Candidatus Wallbacteria bacterium]|nr:PA14 domain-containing protein [Candidatus Wallbacteria bacterium]